MAHTAVQKGGGARACIHDVTSYNWCGRVAQYSLKKHAAVQKGGGARTCIHDVTSYNWSGRVAQNGKHTAPTPASVQETKGKTRYVFGCECLC